MGIEKTKVPPINISMTYESVFSDKVLVTCVRNSTRINISHAFSWIILMKDIIEVWPFDKNHQQMEPLIDYTFIFLTLLANIFLQFTA